MDFGNLEKIESVLLRPCKNLSIKNVIVLGKRNFKDGRKIDSISSKTYNSNKYININKLQTINIETSDFLVFSYFNYKTKEGVEIYFSYPHLYDLMESFKYIMDTIRNEKVFIKDKNGNVFLNEEYEQHVIEIDELVGNKSIKIIFDVYEDEDINEEIKTQEAITIFFNSSEMYSTIRLKELKGLIYFLEKFNLLLSSQNLLLIAFNLNKVNLQENEYDNKTSFTEIKSIKKEKNEKTVLGGIKYNFKPK